MLSKSELFDFLEAKHDKYNRPEYIPQDPISVPHQFSKKEDIEIAAFLTSIISWGTRSSIIKSANKLMQTMDLEPYNFILHASEKELATLKSFVHRTFNGADCLYFIKALKNIYLIHGGLENVFNSNFSDENKNPKQAIVNFRNTFFGSESPGRTYKHISNPAKNSSAKRINMFLRWMVRKDNRGFDFGIWENIRMDQLVCPLDVHTGTVARKLGLLQRKSNDWKAVMELTDNLRKFDPYDPVKYDFALFGSGIYEKF
jgi:uncharacterized protein (TIGR02757 family)